MDGHGTFVGGLACAVGNNNTHVSGMGWNLSLMPVRYYNSPGSAFLHNILEGARWAAENGARCVNVSQTGVEFNTVQTTGAYLKGLGSLLIWAAGNDDRDLSWFDWDDVIIVGSTNEQDGKADFSAYGQAVDVYAPGTNIQSTGTTGGLAIGNGTSSSAPQVAGVCGLIWSYRPHLTPDQVEEALFATCSDLGPLGEDTYWGWGRINSYRAVRGPSPISYCYSSGNSVGGGVTLEAYGSPSVVGNNFGLSAVGGVPDKPGVFFYGPGQAFSLFGEGLLCVAGPIYRIEPVVAFDNLGLASLPIDFTSGVTGSGPGQILPGGEWNFQLWYRDPVGGPAGFNTSNALQVVFWP